MPAIRRRRLSSLGVGAGVLVAVAVSAATALAAPPSSNDRLTPNQRERGICFLRRDWNGAWRVTPDARTIYIIVAHKWIYRLDLHAPYNILKSPLAMLSNRGPNAVICGPNDFLLTASDQTGVVQSPLVDKMTRLTPAEAAALPKSLRP